MKQLKQPFETIREDKTYTFPTSKTLDRIPKNNTCNHSCQ